MAVTAEQLGVASDRLTETASRLSADAQDSAVQADTVAALSREIIGHTSAVATDTHEIQGTLVDISRNAREATAAGVAARLETRRTSEVVDTLAESSDQVGGVIAIITTVAQQTHVLALNATIESARAGAEGYAFAIVADEVKQLATRTARATDAISTLLRGISAGAADSRAAIERISSTIELMTDGQGVIGTAVDEQARHDRQVDRQHRWRVVGRRPDHQPCRDRRDRRPWHRFWGC